MALRPDLLTPDRHATPRLLLLPASVFEFAAPPASNPSTLAPSFPGSNVVIAMKPSRWISVGIAACCLVPFLSRAQKTQPGITEPRVPATLQEIAAQYAAIEQSIEAQYARLMQDIRMQKAKVEDAIKQNEQRIKELTASVNKLLNTVIERETRARIGAINREIDMLKAANAKLKEDLRRYDAQIANLEEQKRKEIAELRKQKDKALSDARKAEEDRRRRN